MVKDDNNLSMMTGSLGTGGLTSIEGESVYTGRSSTMEKAYDRRVSGGDFDGKANKKLTKPLL